MISKAYFSDVTVPTEQFAGLHREDSLMFNIPKNYSAEFEKNPDLYHIALIGVPEDRNSKNIGSALAPDAIRERLYALYKPFDNVKIIDLGNLQQGKTVKDTYVALRDVVTELHKKNIIPVIFGGTQDLSFPVFQAYEKRRKLYNIVTADARLDLNNIDKDLHAGSVISSFVADKPKYLFGLSNLGFQSYYTPNTDKNLMSELLFEAVRLGEVRTNIAVAEPYLRDADFFSFDISSVKMNDAPGHFNPSIHGFYGEEACQLAKYAGMSDRLSTFGLFEVNPLFDERNRTTELAAQIIWHFIQGVYLRQHDFPISKLKQYKQFIVKVENALEDIVFYQSPRTGRWWLEIPYTAKSAKHKMIVSCAESAFRQASANEIPDIWWRYYKKLN